MRGIGCEALWVELARSCTRVFKEKRGVVEMGVGRGVKVEHGGLAMSLCQMECRGIRRMWSPKSREGGWGKVDAHIDAWVKNMHV